MGVTDEEGAREAWRLKQGDGIAEGLVALRLLGGGERYETYLAYDERRLALVVVKVVRPHLIDDEHSLDGLAREAELVARLAHPVIVRGFGAVLEGPRPYLVLEHLEGPRLSTLLRRHGPLEPEQLLPLGAQLASAAHYLSVEGVVHLDIKPSNVIMGAPARLIDLSIARTHERASRRSRAIGTDAYMPPEQCDPVRRGPITAAADVWGIGATLHHAILGRPTFQTDAPHDAAPETRYPQLVRPPEPLPPRTPRAVTDLIESCLATEPDERPLAEEITASFEELVGGLPKRPVLRRFRVRPR